MTTNQSTANTMKELLSDSKNRIKLDDFVTEHIKKFISVTSIQNFPVQGENSLKELRKDFLESGPPPEFRTPTLYDYQLI